MTEPGSPPSTSRSDGALRPPAQGTEEMNNEDDEFGDDFDTFEVGDEHAENDDFGDFDDAFEEPTSGAVMEEPSQEQQTISPEQTSLPSFVSSLDRIIDCSRCTCSGSYPVL